MKMWKRRTARFVAGVALLALPQLSLAQAAQQSTSVIDDLLTRAQNSLNDLQYAQAISFAKQVLDLGDRVPGDKQERALFITAAASYPEGEPAAQNRAAALATFKGMVRSKLDLAIPQALRWPGLDSVLAEAKATTYGMAASANPQQEVVGPGGRAEVNVRVSRPSNFRLAIRSLTGQTTVEVADTTGGTEAKLQFAAMRDDRPLFPAGDYEMIVTATDRLSGDTITSRFSAMVAAEPLTFATVPSAIDTTRFLPERTRKYGWKGVVVGGLVAGSIYGFSSVLHADPVLETSAGPDSKGMGVAALAGISVVAASFMDRGRQIPAAIAANQRTRDDFATSIRTAQAENASRIANYRTVFAITPGAR